MELLLLLFSILVVAVCPKTRRHARGTCILQTTLSRARKGSMYVQLTLCSGRRSTRAACGRGRSPVGAAETGTRRRNRAVHVPDVCSTPRLSTGMCTCGYLLGKAQHHTLPRRFRRPISFHAPFRLKHFAMSSRKRSNCVRVETLLPSSA